MRSFALAVVAGACCFGANARAEKNGPELETPASAPDPMAPWRRLSPGPFVSATLEAGFAYGRADVAAGYGRPHVAWAGVEALPQVSAQFAALYGGLRASLPFLDVRSGARFIRPFFHTPLPVQSDYDTRALSTNYGPVSPYATLEFEAILDIPLGPGWIGATLTGLEIRNVDDEHYVYEENLRAIVAPPAVVRARLGYSFNPGLHGAVRVGPAAELIEIPGRSAHIVRVGLVALFRINAHVDVLAQLLPVVSSPDSIGLAGADFNQLGFRYRWASPR